MIEVGSAWWDHAVATVWTRVPRTPGLTAFLQWVDALRQRLDAVRYLDWQFVLFATYDERLTGPAAWLQIQFDAPDADAPDVIAHQTCRLWAIDATKPADEVIGTAWMAVQAAVEHEAREQFTYRSRAIYGPHFDYQERVQ